MNPDNGGRPWDIRLFGQQVSAVGQRVRTVRKSRGWSQQDLANRTGIGRPSLSGIEGGTQNITLEVLSRLATALQVHWADLLDDRTAAPPPPHAESMSFTEQLKIVGTRVYQTRVLQRLSQQGLTARTGIDRSGISLIELGSQNVTLETLSRLAAGLGVHWADLLDDHQQSTPAYPDRPHDDVVPVPGAAGHDQPRGLALFDRLDQAQLARLSAAELQKHLDARRRLYDYVDQMWRDAVRTSRNPAERPEWAGVAALRGLTHHLTATALDEQIRRRGERSEPQEA